MDHDRGVVRAGRDSAGAGAVAGLCAALVGCTVPTEGFVDPRGELRIEWRFDAEGATVPDEAAAPAEDLQLAGGQWMMSDGPPHLRLDGVDDVGMGPDLQAWLPTLTAVTLEVLVRIDAQPQSWDRRPIVAVPQTSSSGNYGLGLVAYTQAERLELDLVAGDEHVQANADTAYVPGEWIAVHGVYDGEAATLYVDGEPVAAQPAAGALDAYDFDAGRQEVYVGGPLDAHLACGLASIRLYARALGPEEVAHRHRQLAASVTEGAP